MKILLDNSTPFPLAHGGAQIQIEQTKAALDKIGVDVEFLRWWDGNQTGDILHYFGRMSISLVELAHKKGMKVVLTDLLTAQGSRPPNRIRAQKMFRKTFSTALPGVSERLFDWKMYQTVDACVALTGWEARLMSELFGVSPERVHVIPNGVEEIFFQSKSVPRGEWLVCTATITERKRVLEMAEAAVRAQTRLWVVGRAYSDSDVYAKRFFQLAKTNPKIIRFEGAINERERLAAVYREARGFVLLSTMESLSISALEAAACGCPMLLSNLPWARTVFGESVSYCPITADTSKTAAVMRQFYDAAPHLKPPTAPLTWIDVAQQFKKLYESLLRKS